jgi:SAM-dependent methyltransferase
VNLNIFRRRRSSPPAPEPPKRGYRDPFAHGLFPVGVPTHDLGLRRLFDLSSVLLMLECRPGDRVLDLGAGSGFSSEMLARFGYEVVAIDPDLQALRYNRERPAYDHARIDGTISVVGSLAEDLPFADASFDGIVGLNVLHHVPDLERATREFARVLKAGTRAVFCEPGLEHLEMLETKRAIAELGEDDKAFDVFAFLEGARSLGFSQAFFSATLQPPLRMVPVWDVELFASGQHPTRTLNERGVVEEIHRRHAFAMIVRDGERERTSRFPGVLRREIRVEGVPARLVRGRTYRVTAHVRNVGDTRWIAEQSPMGGFVTVGCKFANASGRVVNDLMGRTFLPADVRPQESATVEMAIPVPPEIAPGNYEMRFDTVNEMVCWFSDLPDNPPHVCAVAID